MLDATFVSGARRIADLVGLPQHLAGADLVVVGEGCLDATSVEGKVVGATVALAEAAGVPVAAVVGLVAQLPAALTEVAEASPDGPDGAPAAAVEHAAARVAAGRGGCRRCDGTGAGHRLSV